jgi:hypothetical protein
MRWTKPKKEVAMKRVVLIFLIVASALTPAVAQKIETETNDRTRIMHVKTALNHLTVIEVAEPVVEVASGSSSFKVEWRENKVFVQPTEAEAATNLFIWTANQRLNYELEPAGSLTNMDFAVDQTPVPVSKPLRPVGARPAPAPSITELLLSGKPVRLLPSKQRASKPVEVWISDLYEKDGRLLIRYVVRNHSSEPYSLDAPLVYELDGVHAPESLYGLANSQLGDEQAAKLKAKRQTLVKVLEGQMRPAHVAPGEEGVGVVTLQVGSTTHPTVLRLQFPLPKLSATEVSDAGQPQVDAFLVR